MLTAAGLLDALPEVALLVDERHRILAANIAACAAVGKPREALVGLARPQAIHGESAPHHGCPLESSLACGGCATQGVIAEGDGWFQTAIYPTGARTSDGRRVFLHLLRDITEVHRQELALAEQARVQTAIAGMLRRALEDAPLEHVLGGVLDHLLALPWLAIERKGAILLADEHGTELRMAVHRGMPGGCLNVCETIRAGHCLCGRALQSGEAVFSSGIDDRHDQHYDGMAPHGHYVIPMKAGSRVLGVLNTYLEPGHARDAGEERFLVAVADLCAGIVQRARTRATAVLFRELLDRSHDAVFVADMATRTFVDVNQEASRRLGYPREEIVGKRTGPSRRR